MLFGSCCGTEEPVKTRNVAIGLKCFSDADHCSRRFDYAGGTAIITVGESPGDEINGIGAGESRDSVVTPIAQGENVEIERMLSCAKLRSLAVSDLGLVANGMAQCDIDIGIPAVAQCEDCKSQLTPNMANLGKLPRNFAGDALLEFGVLWRCHRSPQRSLESDYLMTSRELGSCCNGKVRLATSKHGRKQAVAVKTYRLKGMSAKRRKRLRSEVYISLCMDHPHVARLYDVYESDSQINLVMELAAGGSLAARLASVGSYHECEAVFVIKQVLSALCYLHSHGVAHRDLKPENILYSIQGGNYVKLIDFGLSEDVSENWLMLDGCGTLSYVAPEVLHHRCTAQSDLWSLGVIAFVLLSGQMPFRGTDAQIADKIKKATFDFRGDCWEHVSSQAKEFIKALLEIDPSKRLSARKATKQSWIETYSGYRLAAVNAGITKSLCSWSAAPKVQQICRSVIAWRVTDEQQSRLRDFFLALDIDQDGTIDIDELRKALLDNAETADAEAREVLRSLGKNKIRYTDFLAAMIPDYLKPDAALLDSAFARFDTIPSNGISTSVLPEFPVDVDTRGKIDREELANVIRMLKLSGENAFPESKVESFRVLWRL